MDACQIDRFLCHQNTRSGAAGAHLL